MLSDIYFVIRYDYFRAEIHRIGCTVIILQLSSHYRYLRFGRSVAGF